MISPKKIIHRILIASYLNEIEITHIDYALYSIVLQSTVEHKVIVKYTWYIVCPTIMQQLVI